MDAPSINTRRIATLSAGSVAVLAAGLMVWQGSSAAFTETTGNSGNTWAAGHLTLTDDDSGAARFVLNNLVPDQTGSKCIVVSSTTTVPSVVSSYVKNLTASPLADYLTLSIEQGTGGTFNNCAGFNPGPDVPQIYSLNAMSTTYTDFSNAATTWATTGTDSRTFRVTWNFDTSGASQATVDALQGASTGIDIVWELQNN
ncbi:hypothetical protein [Pengzhenrongella sp.]|jgi:hypothetical protein|uniref:hypothetical protein n=1 Tax=Pengzhenrongella sp. TaxID=2888820 RepID=UPI002F937BC8